jgi:hypothetical protein
LNFCFCKKNHCTTTEVWYEICGNFNKFKVQLYPRCVTIISLQHNCYPIFIINKLSPVIKRNSYFVCTYGDALNMHRYTLSCTLIYTNLWFYAFFSHNLQPFFFQLSLLWISPSCVRKDGCMMMMFICLKIIEISKESFFLFWYKNNNHRIIIKIKKKYWIHLCGRKYMVYDIHIYSIFYSAFIKCASSHIMFAFEQLMHNLLSRFFDICHAHIDRVWW